MNNTILGVDSFTVNEAVNLGILPLSGLAGLGKLNNKEVFREMNQKLVGLLKAGKLIYRKPWRDGYRVKGEVFGPHNYETQRPYSGGNAMWIAIYNYGSSNPCEQFLTKKQAEERGGSVKKAPGIWVFAYIKTNREVIDPATNEVRLELKSGIIPYKIYPINMIEGLRPIIRKTKNNTPTKPDEIIVEAETILAGMPKRPPIAHGGDQAFYSPSEDRVQMPPKKAFDKTQEYYSVLFHELVHSTGHKSRVGREFKGRSGDKDYAFEELIAEIGASYLCGVSGIEYYTINNSAAYIKGWSTKLGDILSADEKFFFRAVIAATRAAKYIIAESVEKEGKKQIKSPVKPVKKK